MGNYLWATRLPDWAIAIQGTSQRKTCTKKLTDYKQWSWYFEKMFENVYVSSKVTDLFSIKDGQWESFISTGMVWTSLL